MIGDRRKTGLLTHDLSKKSEFTIRLIVWIWLCVRMWNKRTLGSISEMNNVLPAALFIVDTYCADMIAVKEAQNWNISIFLLW